ncbi:hypothetical protein GSI_01373 [Ganoderma sinense ZZ0214-1]|uniref:Uncharacterized protein n=1 Tax=Ganoderma sinense ZZ0214-1 TaxID=1077348 RepID=A0A2G8SV83_9APHY|nr:hypothetical protein GSI_01373 [Ganoderma sinense ZZ0214-1]
MHIYNGKFSCEFASNEAITVVFPAGFELHDPVSAYWQWTNDSKLGLKAGVANSGHIHSITKTSNGYYRIHFSFGHYSFDGTMAGDCQTLCLIMVYPSETGLVESDPFTLTAMHTNTSNVRSGIVYTGNLEWAPNAAEEMVTIVVPYGVTEGAFFGLYYQWTMSPLKHVPKQNVAVCGVFQDVKIESNGTITTTYKDAEYTYKFTFCSNKKGFFVVSHNRNGSRSDDNAFTFAYKL